MWNDDSWYVNKRINAINSTCHSHRLQDGDSRCLVADAMVCSMILWWYGSNDLKNVRLFRVCAAMLLFPQRLKMIVRGSIFYQIIFRR